MKPSAIWSEAFRSVVTGAARAGLWAALLAAVAIGLTVADQRQIVRVAQAAHAYRDAGATTYVLYAPSRVDGSRCDRLTLVDGVVASGALRDAGQVTVSTIPNSPLTHLEATAGMAQVLQTELTGSGVWVADAVADLLSTEPGATLPTNQGNPAVAGVYRYPADANDRTAARAVVSLTPAMDGFDQCWVRLWPVTQDALALVHTAVGASQEAELPAQTQLVTRRGASHDANQAYLRRPTRGAAYGAALAGALIGFASAWTRRLEHASALHAGVSNVALAWQRLGETALWSLPVLTIAVPVTLLAATVSNPDPAGSVWGTGLRVVTAAVLAVHLGALAGTRTISERRLFTYFKNR
jgi:hypothetical protein